MCERETGHHSCSVVTLFLNTHTLSLERKEEWRERAHTGDWSVVWPNQLWWGDPKQNDQKKGDHSFIPIGKREEEGDSFCASVSDVSSLCQTVVLADSDQSSSLSLSLSVSVSFIHTLCVVRLSFKSGALGCCLSFLPSCSERSVIGGVMTNCLSQEKERKKDNDEVGQEESSGGDHRSEEEEKEEERRRRRR